MKKLVTLLMCVFAVRGAMGAGFYDSVTNLWWQGGNKTNVLALAEERLAVNSNDIGGLIVKMEYYGDRLMIDEHTNMIPRVIAVADAITNEHFAAARSFFKDELENIIEVCKEYTPEKLNEDMPKRDLPELRFIFTEELEALKADGLID